ncbi:MAG: hypothetical protein Q8936_06030 [Bacillota bacterium]|nr:hypothetical protein [Bacillota bacterium]
MQGIRAWDYGNKEFYIEYNFNYILSVIKHIGQIILGKEYIPETEENRIELSKILAIRSVQDTPKKNDYYEILFREQIIDRFYDLDSPEFKDGVNIFSVNKIKLKELIKAAEEQSAQIFMQKEAI